MGVAGMHSVELVKDTLQVILLDTYTIVFYLYVEVGGIAFGGDLQLQADIVALVLDGIIHQVEDDVGEVHFIHLDHRVGRIQIGLQTASVLHHLDIECLHDTVYQFVGIQGLHLQGYIASIVQRHLQDLLHLIAQALCLSVNHSAQALVSVGGLLQLVVREHLCGNAYGGYGCLELVRHIVDEVVLQFGQPLLSDNEINRNQESDKEEQGKEQCQIYHIGDLQHIPVEFREMYAHNSHFSRRVVTEECLAVTVVLSFRVVVRTTVNLASLAIEHPIVEFQFYAVVAQGTTQCLHQKVLVHTLLKAFFSRGIQYAEDDLVQNLPFIYIRIADSALEGPHPGHGYVHAVRRRVHVQRVSVQAYHILKIQHRLVSLKIPRCGVKAPQDTFIELLSSNCNHGSCIPELQVKQHHEADTHGQADCPNHPSFHSAKITITYPSNKKESGNRSLFCFYLDISGSLVNKSVTMPLFLFLVSTLVLGNEFLLYVAGYEFIACELGDEAGTATGQA